MPSVFDLFGTVTLDTGEFDASVKKVVDRLRTADAELDKTRVASNKLGDTSATVARRYEKLNEQIDLQKQRLLDAANAFSSGDIKAKKFESALKSVETQTRNLTSRIKDAQARVQELDATGLTHFQQQIKGATAEINANTSAVKDNINALLAQRQAQQAAQPVSVTSQIRNSFNNLSLFQKTQLSYQLNDVVSGLLSGQPITQIAAQQGGQILQIFQQSATAGNALAVSTTNAATATAKVAESAALANTSVKATVNNMLAVRQGAEGTATAMEASAAASTTFAGTLVSIGAVLAAGVVTILAAKKASEDVLKTATDRLKTEEKITAAFNEQYLIAVELKKTLAEIVSKGATDRFLKGFDNSPGGISSLQGYQAQLQSQLDENIRNVTIERGRRESEADRIGLTGESRAKYIEEAIPKGFKEANEKLAEQIKAAATQVEVLKNSQQTSAEWYTDQQKKQQEFYKQTADVQEQYTKRAADAAKKLADAQEKLAQATVQRINELRGKELDAIGRGLTDYQLKREAQEFRQGFRFGPQSATEKLQGQLASLPGLQSKIISEIVGSASGGALGASNITRTYQQFDFQKNLNPQEKRKLEEAIIQATAGVDPAALTTGQRRLAAQAREDIVKQDRDELLDTLKELRSAVKTGTLLHIIDDSNGRAKIETRPTGASTANFYNGNQ